jgi:hypothetical protein
MGAAAATEADAGSDADLDAGVDESAEADMFHVKPVQR